ncbi:DHA2 family efflux MFS transporter permease subunit [Shewanella surugensis]|uniref:DHA2 family efflux MFS transporter permease subunit n=1 Tax=Shewanella surugensis TaxID=212020 RepID=A0ABT0LEZ4_9GAMM|nr:DHA2 family efflux MFS transporter permease subunit [Shewanella surugensis]MCL1126060.1 DHA2 family efflux MFS transporter permease subunit [Shewanella surugensis]
MTDTFAKVNPVAIAERSNGHIVDYSQGSQRAWIAIFGGLVGAFMAILDIQITNSSLKEIQGGLGATVEEGSWISTSYLVAEMIAIPLSGWLSKVCDVRRYAIWNTVLFIMASLLCSISWNLESMITFRAMQGFFGGALIPMAFSLILEKIPIDKRSIGMALFGLTATFAPSIGPTFGGWLTEQFNWSYLFYINVPPGIIVIAMFAYGLPKKTGRWSEFKKGDFSGIVTMALGLGALEVVLEDGNRKGWFDSDIMRNLAIIAVINITLFVYLQLRKSAPLVNLRLFAKRDFVLSTLAYFFLGWGLFAGIYMVPLYLAQIQNYSAMEIGEVLMWMGFPQLFLLPLMPKIMQKIDSRYLVSFGFFMFGMSYYLNSHMTLDFAGEQMILSMVVRAMGLPFVIVPLGTLATDYLKVEENASASTLLNVMRNLGGAFGIALVATFIDNLTRMHLSQMRETIPAVSVQAAQYLQQTAQVLQLAGSNAVMANQQANKLLMQTMQQQASIQAYNDVFLIVASILLFAAVIVLGIRKAN